MLQTADLHFTGGGSDKVYHLLQNGPDLHIAYGRRGAGLNISKTTLVSETKAAAEFQKKFMEKLGKGYQVADGISGPIWGAALAGLPSGGHIAECVMDTRKKAMEKIPSGFLPQLLNEISEEEAQKYIQDDAWGAQEKKNGRRHTVLVDDANTPPRAANKLGFTIPTFVTFKHPVHGIEMDGEAIGGRLHVFDLLKVNGQSLKGLPYQLRHAALVSFYKNFCNSSVSLVNLFTTTQSKQNLWDVVKADGGEGIVFKRLDAPHTEGRPNRLGDQLKVIFWQHTQALVTGITDGKRSVALACYNPTAANPWKPVGNVTIPPNYDMPIIGDYVEIRYKYYYEGGSLFQPQYEGTTDVAVASDTALDKLLRFTGEE